MKKTVTFSVTLLLLVMLAQFPLMSGCTSRQNGEKTPQQLIEDAYGNQEFTISFSSETLDAPLEDLVYSAHKIPKLPIPQKVGYIFEGWFLDPDFVVPYMDDLLYLTMENITLYPKWAKETFLHNGTYDIEFTAGIVPGTVEKGEITDEFGGYRDFSKAINHEACCIEKNEKELLLKLQFDCGAVTPFQSAGEIYTVRIHESMGTGIFIEDKIDSPADPVKTLFLRINDWDLSKPLYLDINWTNYEHKDLTESTRYKTTTTYTVAIDLTKIIGFSQAFVDPEAPLEKGYYLAKSYFRKENNEDSMAKTYNPVYSYIYSDGKEHYKLIKQNSPYAGLVADRHPLFDPLTDNYYDTLMTFTAASTLFDVSGSRDAVGAVESDYYPATYDGGYYRNSVTEFHADTGKFYNIFDIDRDLKKEYIVLSAVSGYMERESGMGYIRQLMSIDYMNLIKLPEVDYQPLEGDAYEYEDAFNFYPGDYNDLDQKNITYDALHKFGLSIPLPDFFYAAPNQNAPLKERTMFSSRVEVTPSQMTSSLRVSESRYVIGEFHVNTKVYGYDVRDGKKLYLDRMRPQAFEGENYNCMLRDVAEIKTGRSCQPGDVIDVVQLFNEKVSREVDFANVRFQAVEINDGHIDFDKRVGVVDKKITFDRDVAIEYSYELDGHTMKTVVELKQIPEPEITFRGDQIWTLNEKGHYVKDEPSHVADRVPYPRVTYQWGTVSQTFVANFYERPDGSDSINPSVSAIIANREGYKKLYLPVSHTSEMQIPEQDITLMYEMQNEFGERKFLYFDYNSKPRKSYTILDDKGNLIVNNDLKFDEEGMREDVYYAYTGGVLFGDFDESHIKQYVHKEGGFTDPYRLAYYDIYTSEGNLLHQSPASPAEMVANINQYLSGKAYGCVTFMYRHDSDWLEVNYLYNISFNGESNYHALNYDTYFTEFPYAFAKSKLVGSNRQPLAKASVNVRKYVDGRPSVNNSDRGDIRIDSQDNQYIIEFLSPGTYKIELSYRIPTSLLGNPNRSSKEITFSQMVEVYSRRGDIQITYKTDKLHPFRGGALEKTVTYNLAEGIQTLTGLSDVFDKSRFAPGRSSDSLFCWSTTRDNHGDLYKSNTVIPTDEFIHTFNSGHITLNAIWEINFEVDCQVNETISKTVVGKMDQTREMYKVELPTVKKGWIPSGSIFAGWTGGFLGDRLVTDKTVYVPYRDDYYDTEKYQDYFTIHAVFKKELKVEFDIDPAIAEGMRSTKVLEGNTLKNPLSYTHVNVRDPAYRFVGYVVKGRESEGIVNLSDYIIRENTTFVAQFEKIG